MMGYIPSMANPFNAVDEKAENVNRVLPQEGEVLRYRNTAKSGQGRYSEIGFYKAEKAQWPLNEGEEDFPSIDVLTLDSTGNIRETAENHHLQKAKRIEILADAPEVLDRKPTPWTIWVPCPWVNIRGTTPPFTGETSISARGTACSSRRIRKYGSRWAAPY
jgi:hypothetical protein